jgi:type I restriction enzyme S subunit
MTPPAAKNAPPRPGLPLRFFLDTKSTFGIPQVQGLENGEAWLPQESLRGICCMSELGKYQLPKGWAWATIPDITGKAGVFIDGDWVESKNQDPEGDVRLIQLADVGDGVYRDKSNRYMTKTKAEQLGCTFLKEGDVLIARMPDPLGRACIFPGDAKPAVTVVDIAIARSSNGEFDHRWLACFVNAHPFRSAIFGLQAGSTRKRISRGNLATIPLPVPPLDEQRQIVAEIEKQFTRLDTAVAALRRVQANLKRYRAAVLKAACEGKMVPTEAELAKKERRKYETAGELVARTPTPPRPNRWNSRSKDVIPGHSALAVGNPQTPLPEGWAWSALVEIAKMESGHTPSRNHPEWWDGDVAWIGIVDARENDGRTIHETIQHTNAEGIANSASRLLPAGTVCISRTASVGYVVTMGREMATSQDFVNWIPTSAVTSDWLRIIFSADREALRRFGKGSVHKTIYFPEWLSTHVALPPFAEQVRIVEEVERRLSVVEELEAVVAANLQRATRLRQSILQKAFEGNL